MDDLQHPMVSLDHLFPEGEVSEATCHRNLWSEAEDVPMLEFIQRDVKPCLGSLTYGKCGSSGVGDNIPTPGGGVVGVGNPFPSLEGDIFINQISQ